MTSLTGKIVKKKQGPVINTTPVIVPVPSYNPNDKDIHSEKSVTNPKYIGPGVWYTIHSAAKKACISGDFSAKKAFVDLMNYYRTNFSCIKC